jgi:DNA polymerase I-like protein with 3'-5' exonuclease and polymerase domains
MRKFKSIRQTFLPDDGCLFVKADFSQAEVRIGDMYCGTDRMVQIANSKPWDFDVHADNAVMIFGPQIKQLPKDEFKQLRYLGKKVVHASWREMGGNKMSESVSKDTEGKVFIPPKKCNKLIGIYHQKNPEIKQIYFPWVRNQVHRVGVLFNSWGRRYDVRNLRIDDELLRGCYSYYMQSECADWTNQWLFLPAYKYLMKHYNKPPNLQIHDEVASSVPPDGLYDYCQYLVESGEQAREVPAGSGRKLVIPLDVTISDTLYGGIEFSPLPDRQEFNERIKDYFGGNI